MAVQYSAAQEVAEALHSVAQLPKHVRRGERPVKGLRPLTLPKKARTPFDGVASLVVDRA